VSSRESSRDRILEAAHRLLRERGAAVSMAEVAEAARVSRQALYMHYSSRAGLLVALVRWMDEEAGIVAQCTAALEDEDPPAALRRFLVLWLRYVATIQPVASALLAVRRNDSDASTAWEDRMAQLRLGHRRAAQSLEEAGLLRDGLNATTAADLSWTMSSVPVWEQLAVDRHWSASRIELYLVDAIVAALIEPD